MKSVLILLLTYLALMPMLLHGTMAEGTNHNAPRFWSSQGCRDAINSKTDVSRTRSLQTEQGLTMVSWNIEKGSNDGWLQDLQDIGEQAQLVLLQEAVYVDEMKNASEASIYHSFSPGFQTARYNSGIMTLSRSEPDLLCTFQNREPWLRTPKTTSITRFPLQDKDTSLLLVNIHQINFAITNADYQQQLEEMASVLRDHKGPLIVSGDFNTWKDSRMDLLQDITSQLQLHAVEFDPDYRKKFLGIPLDHVYVRGFKVRQSSTIEVESSDHNPLILTLDLLES